MTPFALLFALKQTSTFVGQSDFPPVTAEAAIIVHANSARILWGRNVDLPMYPASTTKLLTTLLLLENSSPTDTIQAPEDTKKVRGSSLNLQPFERISAEGAAYALMLRSANDVAHAVALKLGGSDQGFASQMNQYSRKLGMRHSHWETPHGLNNDWHKTTARDLSLLGQHALKNKALIDITSTQKYTIQRDINQKDTLLINRNKLLAESENIKGFKTGYTNPAGLCFVGYIQSPIGDLVTVVLNSRDWAADQVALTNWANESFHQTDNILAKSSVSLQSPNAKENQQLIAVPRKPLPLLASNEDRLNYTITPKFTSFPAPIKKGEVLTPATVTLPDGTEYETELIAENDVQAKASLSDLIRNPIGIGLILLASAAYWYRKRTYDKLNLG